MSLRNILLVIGFTALAAGAILAALWISAAPRKTASPVPGHSILVAAHPIATGALLRPDDIAWRIVPSTDVSPSYLVRGQVSEADYAGAVARRDFSQGEALVAAGIVRRNERGFLAAVLAPGKRAISIAVDASQSSSGLVLPGDHVDVILTQHIDDGSSGPGEMVGETVLRDLRVIAVDQSLSASAAGGAVEATSIAGPGNGPKVPKTITLEVSQREAESLSVAGELGKLELSVRALESASAQPNESDTTRGPMWSWEVSAALGELRRTQQVSHSTRLPEPAAAANAPAAQPRLETHIEVMHGSKIENR